jgi:hypothetical protein
MPLICELRGILFNTMQVARILRHSSSNSLCLTTWGKFLRIFRLSPGREKWRMLLTRLTARESDRENSLRCCVLEIGVDCLPVRHVCRGERAAKSPYLTNAFANDA